MGVSINSSGDGRWSVAATVREPVALLAAFVSHHLSLGAQEVILYLDAPDVEAIELLGAIPQCRLVVCNSDYWRVVIRKKRPSSHIRRQLENVYHAYQTTRSEWLLHLDADEFLRPSSGADVAQTLAAMPDHLHGVKVANLERIYSQEAPATTIFDGVFRHPFHTHWSDAEKLLDPVARPFLYRGLTAYAQGKSFSRVGQRLIPGIHSPRGIKGFVNSWYVPGLEILHFDGLTPLHWATKLMRFADHTGHLTVKNFGQARLEQIKHVQNSENVVERIAWLHDLLKVQSREQIARLAALSLIDQTEFNPTMALRQFGLSDKIDLSLDAFDRHLSAENPTLQDMISRWQGLEQTAVQISA